MAITGRFVIFFALGAVPIVILSDQRVIIWWSLLSLALMVTDVLLAGSPRQLTLERDLPALVRLGETVTSTVYLTNRGRRAVRGLVRDAWQPSAGAAARRSPLRLPVGERRALSTTLTPFRRGLRQSAHVTVRSFGPLGFAARQATIAVPGTISVLPPFNSRKHLPSRVARLRELDGLSSLMVRGHGTEFDSLREYVRGDDVRSIDWRATARRSELVVRTWRPERDRRVVIIIDSGRTSAARIDNEPRIDTAFESSLLLAALATRAGDRVDLLIYDRRVRGRVQGATGSELLSRMVNVMGPIQPELIEMDWTSVPGLVRSVTTHRALVVIMTSIDSAGASAGLLAVLPQLTRQHRVIVATVTDPDVDAATHARPNRDAVYLAAAAERALLDTTRVAAAITQLGAHVVQAVPSELPPALSDRYIALKAAGQL